MKKIKSCEIYTKFTHFIYTIIYDLINESGPLNLECVGLVRAKDQAPEEWLWGDGSRQTGGKRRSEGQWS